MPMTAIGSSFVVCDFFCFRGAEGNRCSKVAIARGVGFAKKCATDTPVWPASRKAACAFTTRSE
ncbi:MAG TPA: hypothetical protein PLD46_05430, partial [Hyphomicrobium sp.]|nr:hypothetical protein [Hyphomicrobium sp.]